MIITDQGQVHQNVPQNPGHEKHQLPADDFAPLPEHRIVGILLLLYTGFILLSKLYIRRIDITLNILG